MAHRAAQLTNWRTLGWALAALLTAAWAPAARAQISSQVTNTTSGTITDNSCGTGSAMTRSFTVTANVKITDVNLGVFVGAHLSRRSADYPDFASGHGGGDDYQRGCRE